MQILNKDVTKKLRSLQLTNDSWERSKKAAKKMKPESTRQAWIEYAIQEQLKKEGIE